MLVTNVANRDNLIIEKMRYFVKKSVFYNKISSFDTHIQNHENLSVFKNSGIL